MWFGEFGPSREGVRGETIKTLRSRIRWGFEWIVKMVETSV